MTETQPIISSKPPCSREDALAVLKRLREHGHTAYFAGGCVRDELMGLDPKDYDVATDAPPQRVRELFKNTQAVGAAFGVILVRQGKSMVEVATFRIDGAYLDGRRPSKVRFTTAEQDAKRRDFTINGLFLDPVDGKVIDYVGGQEDLKAKILRAIGEPAARFAEDHLRLLRAVRFAARFGLTIDVETAKAITAHAKHLKAISPERIAEELRLMLAPTRRGVAWRLLNQFGLLEIIFRFAVPATVGPADPQRDIPLHLGDDRAPLGLALAAMAAARQEHVSSIFDPKFARALARAMRQSLRISNGESDDLEQTLIGAGMILSNPPVRLAIQKRFLARPTAGLSRRLMCAIAAAGIGAERIQTVQRELDVLSRTDFAPPPLITGDDLTAAGLQPGKVFKHILVTIYDAQLEGRITAKADAMSLAMRLAGGED